MFDIVVQYFERASIYSTFSFLISPPSSRRSLHTSILILVRDRLQIGLFLKVWKHFLSSIQVKGSQQQVPSPGIIVKHGLHVCTCTTHTYTRMVAVRQRRVCPPCPCPVVQWSSVPSPAPSPHSRQSHASLVTLAPGLTSIAALCSYNEAHILYGYGFYPDLMWTAEVYVNSFTYMSWS